MKTVQIRFWLKYCSFIEVRHSGDAVQHALQYAVSINAAMPQYYSLYWLTLNVASSVNA